MFTGGSLRAAVDAARTRSRDHVPPAYQCVVEALMAAEREAVYLWPGDYGAPEMHSPIQWLLGARITVPAWEALEEDGVDVFPVGRFARHLGGRIQEGMRVDVAQLGPLPLRMTMDLIPSGLGIRMRYEPEWPGARHPDRVQ